MSARVEMLCLMAAQHIDAYVQNKGLENNTRYDYTSRAACPRSVRLPSCNTSEKSPPCKGRTLEHLSLPRPPSQHPEDIAHV